MQNSSIFRESNFLSNHTVPFEIPEMEVQDIDNQSDWELAELKFQMCREKNENDRNQWKKK